ncbi:glycoside hydrolase family 5 protein [Phanerochaete carnosa HHB-10118-sp]|uniref:Glycoside hydrolase family 5 protein n=1 Tax=Phanerochaete carnosa (strain HHB-10118-sp) TaxID=650164 RepID=K5V524_PHACS|nr:glycoside hydrolase family 5 protein [Phanerochaete carnosa HHB-10118-sp]EKM57736.1 glycoside hydrolase family 5 protein [Phanerochaete carnosa HHB-10118-sp]
MHKFVDSLKNKLHGRGEAQEGPGVQAVLQDIPSGFPSPSDFFRYRKQRGVNLGSWFVLERWIAESPFHSATPPGQSDHDVARGPQAKEVLEHHWDTWITEQDFAWIAQRGFNAVRLPIGYYHLCGVDPSVLKGTDFENLGDVYQGAWSRITNAIQTANGYGLGVLIGESFGHLHAAPGKQNRDAHAGTSGELRFYNKANKQHTIYVLTVLAGHLSSLCRSSDPALPNILGIELLNEPQHDPSLDRWYLDAIRAVRSVDPSIPVYIGDSWMTDQYANFIESHANTIPFTVLDHHLYRCFTQDDTSTSASQHAHNLRDPNAGTPQIFARVSQKLQGAGGALVVGEWSGALNPGSLRGIGDDTGVRREYLAAQLALYEQYCAGYFFWTYKKEQPGDKGWSLRDAVAAGVFPSRVGLSKRDVVLRDDPQQGARRDYTRDQALGASIGTRNPRCTDVL